MLCKACKTFCLFQGLLASGLVFQQVKCILNWILIRWLTWPRIFHFWSEKTPWLRRPIRFEALIGSETHRQYVSVFIIAAAAHRGSHTCPSYNTSANMFDRWGGMLWIMSGSFFSPHFPLSITGWSSSHLSITLSSKSSCSSTSFLIYSFANCNLTILFLMLSRGSHLVVNPLRLCGRSLLSIVIFDYLCLHPGVFFLLKSYKGIYLSSTTQIFSGHCCMYLTLDMNGWIWMV